jgi:O-antigen ligase
VHVKTKKAPVSVSHTEPITVAAEQGLVGLVLYVALVVTALWTMASRAGPARQKVAVARAAVLATFAALLVHTMAYAGFFEDPITWVLLAVGVSLAAAQQRRLGPCPDTSVA